MDALCSVYNLMQTLERVWSNLEVNFPTLLLLFQNISLYDLIQIKLIYFSSVTYISDDSLL